MLLYLGPIAGDEVPPNYAELCQLGASLTKLASPATVHAND